MIVRILKIKNTHSYYTRRNGNLKHFCVASEYEGASAEADEERVARPEQLTVCFQQQGFQLLPFVEASTSYWSLCFLPGNGETG